MNQSPSNLENLLNQPYKYGFKIPIETENFNKGLTEEIIRLISNKKNEPIFMLDFRLKAFKKWKQMNEPKWAFINYTKPDYQSIKYYSVPPQKKN